jgi:hypothetical protein
VNGQEMQQLQLQSEASGQAILEPGTVVYTLFAIRGGQKWYLGFVTEAYQDDSYDVQYSDGKCFAISIRTIHTIFNTVTVSVLPYIWRGAF